MAAFLNTPEATVRDRYDQIPPEEREYYLRTSLDILGL